MTHILKKTLLQHDSVHYLPNSITTNICCV